MLTSRPGRLGIVKGQADLSRFARCFCASVEWHNHDTDLFLRLPQYLPTFCGVYWHGVGVIRGSFKETVYAYLDSDSWNVVAE
jgi:hypothetical protein